MCTNTCNETNCVWVAKQEIHQHAVISALMVACVHMHHALKKTKPVVIGECKVICYTMQQPTCLISPHALPLGDSNI